MHCEIGSQKFFLGREPETKYAIEAFKYQKSPDKRNDNIYNHTD